MRAPPGIFAMTAGASVVACTTVVGLALTLPGGLGAQGFRGEARVSTGYLEARPLVRDSLPAAEVPGDGLRRRLPDGRVVTCTQGDYCRWYRAGDVDGLLVMTQDLTLTGWSDIEGLSAHVHLRGRYGSDTYWPLSGQEFEAVSAYVDYDRSDYRIRGGRLYRQDGLGYYNFDGASFLWRKWDPWWIEVYGGFGLARGLNVPRSGDLVSRADGLAPDDRGFIVGAEAGGRLGRIGSARISYQREIRTDRLAIYAERLSLDTRAFLDGTIVELSGEYDWSFQQLNELRLRATRPLPLGLEVTAEARHHTPFFELWTIWGAFSPVGFNEARLSAAWSEPELGLSVRAAGAYRDYEESNAGVTDSGIRDDGWRAELSAGWAREDWFTSGSYRAEAGFGAARFGGDVRAGRRFGQRGFVAFRGSLTQTFGEFRLNEQLVSGLGLDGSVRLGDLRLNAGGALYRIGAEERPVEDDWTQLRVYSSLSYDFGFQPRTSESPDQGGGTR